ncbi:TerB family tellurite resistance protein [Maribacter confluentis]|uniref:TerB family tellurite resistance protein n=1 Tax=Maribacter confluentis TaxID=1656093 RepID=A0ABT8RTI8_9FLAO|nr:TerB family tellurite resistance protein [Maribacter confluentis]MDO1514030.1 TerB family tellurite resistance protein [Maribacter confluentis]
MPTEKEKLSILSEMIEFAKVDNEIRRMEYDFLFMVAQRLNITKETFDRLFKERVEHILPKSQAERIIQFHRLVLLMNVDHQQDITEVKKLHDIGLKMGLPPGAIQQVLMIMHQYPNKIVPPDVLITIFKSHYN